MVKELILKIVLFVDSFAIGDGSFVPLFEYFVVFCVIR